MAYRDVVLADAPVIYLELEQTSGNPVNTGSQSMSSYTVTAGVDRSESGVAGNAWHLPAASDRVVVTYGSGNNSIYTDQVWSVELWVKTTESQNFFLATLGYTASNYTNHFAYLYLNGGKLTAAVRGTATSTIGNNATINDGEWHHVALTINGSTKKLYVDGELDSTVTSSHGTLTPSQYQWTLGTNAVSSSAVGTYDEFAVYNSELTAEQIAAHYDAAFAPQGTNAGYTAQPMTASTTMPGGSGQGNVQSLPITADTYIYDTTSHGSETSVVLDFENTRLGLFAVVTPTIPAGENLASARLRLYVNSNGGGADTFYIYRVTGAWIESSTTPRPARTLVKTISATATPSTWLELDVTDVVSNWLSGGINNGIAVSTDGIMSVQSRENTNKPTLVVATSVPTARVVNADPMTATAAMSDPTVSTSSGVSASGQPFAATAELLNATASVEAFVDREVDAEPMAVYADMGDSGFAVPTSQTAEALHASAEVLDAAVATEEGVLASASPMTATATWKQPASINDQPIELDESEDNYFQRVLTAAPKVWFRLNDKGSVAVDRMGGLGGIYSGVQTGQFNAPNNRHSVYFNGNAYIEQVEPSATNVDEWLEFLNGFPQATLEFSFRTTKKNTFLMAGKDNTGTTSAQSPTSPRELYLRDGKISLVNHNWSFTLGRSTGSDTITGFRDIADGEWHHVVLKTAPPNPTLFDEGGMEIWIDGKFEIRRRNHPAFLGFPDFIGSRPSSIDGFEIGALPSSQNFVGDMSETAFYTYRLSDDAIPRHYYDFMGWNPIEAQPVEAFAFTPADHRGKGNQKRALYLWWDATVDAYAIGGDGFNNKMNFDPVLDGHGKFGTYNLEGYKVFSMGVTVNSRGQGYYDRVTDRPTVIDLEHDVDIDDFDVIMFGDWPDEGSEIDMVDQGFPGGRERLISQLRWANNRGVGLMVTHPRMAVDLGIVDRVEFVPTLREYAYNNAQGNAMGLYDYGSAAKFPWNITASSGLEGIGLGSTANGQPMNTDPAFLRNKAFFYGDTNKNDKFRVRALIDGLTNIPSYMIKDAVYQKDYDQWGWSVVAYKYLHRLDGLLIGDEFFIHGSDMGMDLDGVSWNFDSVRAGRWRGYYAAPMANVKAGTVVTTFGAKHWNGQAEVDNPYRNYATTIVLQPGDSLAGKPVGGRIFVNFTEQPNRFEQAVAVQELPENNADFPYTYTPDTDLQREWEWSETRKSLRTTGNPGSTAVNVIMPDGTTLQISTSGGQDLQMTRSNNIFPLKWFPKWDMTRRGLWWLQHKVEVEPGANTQVAGTLDAIAEMPSPTVVAQRDASTKASPMVALGRLPKVAEDVSGDVEYTTLPMTAAATFTGFSKVISVEPMTAEAELVENFDMVHATGEQVVLTLHSVDLVTLYLKEEE